MRKEKLISEKNFKAINNMMYIIFFAAVITQTAKSQNTYFINTGSKIITSATDHMYINGTLQNTDTGVFTNNGKIKITGNLTNSSVFSSGNQSDMFFYGTSAQKIINDSVMSFYNAEINNAGGVSLDSGDISVNGLLTLTSGIFTTGNDTIDLGTSGSISEVNPSATAPTSYVTGNVNIIRNIGNSTNQTFGGTGLEINESNTSNNSTTVTRVSGTTIASDENTSIQRYFDITPVTNTGLAASMKFYYFNNELTGIPEDSLKLFESVSPYTTWTARGGTINSSNNYSAKTAISSFSRWTLSSDLGSTCGKAIEITPGTYYNPQTFTIADTVMWFKFIPDSAENYISVRYSSSPEAEIDNIYLYSGNCSSLTNIYSSSESDSLIIYAQGMTTGNTYYIKVKRGTSDNGFFDIDIHANQTAKFTNDSLCPPVQCVNLVSNGSFDYVYDSDGIVDHFDPFCPDNLDVCGWYKMWGSPQLDPANTNLTNHVAKMWYYSNYDQGESVYTNLSNNLINGQNYQLSISYKNTGVACTGWRARFTNMVPASYCTNGCGDDLTDYPFTTSNSTPPVIDVTTNSPAWLITSATFQYDQTFTELVIYPYSATNGITWLLIDNVIILPFFAAEAGSAQTICNGGCVSIGGSPTASGGTSPYTYLWSPSTGLSSTTVSNPNACPASTTTYTVTVTGANGCTATDGVTITVYSLPTANAGSDVSICNGASTQLSASGGTTYSWSPATGLSATNIYNPVASPSTTTAYTVTVTGASGCTATDDVTVTVNPSPALSYTATDETCFGATDGSIDLSVTGGTSPYSYNWENSNNVSYGTTQDLTDLITDTYTVTVTGDNGCTATTSVAVGAASGAGWPYQPDGTEREAGSGVAVDNNGNVYATGRFSDQISFINTLTSSGGTDIYVVKFDECGDPQWDKRIGGTDDDTPNNITVDNNGNIIVTGYFSNTVNFGGGNRTSQGAWDLFVVKYASDGTWIWDYTYGAASSNVIESGNDVTVDASNNVYVVGTVNGGTVNNPDYDIFLNKLNGTTGAQAWANPVIYNSSSLYDYGYGITYSSHTAEILITGQSNWYAFIRKYDASGSLQGMATYTTSSGMGNDIVTYYDVNTSTDLAYVAGSIVSGYNIALFIATVPANSNPVFQTPLITCGGSADDYATDLEIDADGNIYLTGQFYSSAADFPVSSPAITLYNYGSFDNFVVKYNHSSGDFDWGFNSHGTDIEENFCISMNNVGFGYVTGEFWETTVLGSCPSCTLTAVSSSDAFIARLHDLISTGAYEKHVNISDTDSNSFSEEKINVYPNPANDKLFIDLLFDKNTKTKVGLYDLLGNRIRLLDEGVFRSRHIVTGTNTLSYGVYLLRVETPDKVILKKIMIVH